MPLPLLAALFCDLALGGLTLAVLIAQLRGRYPRPGIPLAAGLVLLTALFLFTASVSAEELSPSAAVLSWTRLYGQETTRAALLTTDRFRQREHVHVWAERTHHILQQIGYHHLGGQVVKEVVREGTATVFLKARIRTLIGVTEQTEIYTLRQVGGQWLIDSLEVRDEVIPEEENFVACAACVVVPLCSQSQPPA